MKDIKIRDFGVLIKDVPQAIEKTPKEQRGGLLEMLLRTLGTILWGNMLAGNGVTTACDEVTIARHDFLIVSHVLFNFEIRSITKTNLRSNVIIH